MKVESERVRGLRERRGWSQQQLAEVAGVSVRTVQRLESGGLATGETRMALAAALEVGPETLAAEAPVSGGQQSAPPQPAQSLGFERGMKIAWTGMALLGFLLVAGYQVGKDMALRDNARAAEAAATSG